MPAKKQSTKKGSKKGAQGARTRAAAATTSKTIALTGTQAAAARRCLERSGKIKLGFKELTLTRLPRTIAPVLVFVD